MKTIFKYIIIALVACLILSALAGFPSFDEVKSGFKDAFDFGSSDQEFEEKTFYVTSGDGVKEYTSISSLPDGTRGFFVKGDNVFFAMKSSGHDTLGCNIDPDTLTYGGYEYCYYTTTDMVTFTNWSDDWCAVFDQPSLIVYLAVKNLDYDETIELSDNLLADQPVIISYADPPEIEGPGAE